MLEIQERKLEIIYYLKSRAGYTTYLMHTDMRIYTVKSCGQRQPQNPKFYVLFYVVLVYLKIKNISTPIIYSFYKSVHNPE